MYLKAFLTKSSRWPLAILALLLGAFVYAMVDRTAYTTEQLVVIPDTVVSDTWGGVENALLGDIGEESLFQDFGKTNSAYLNETHVRELLAPLPDLNVPTIGGETTSSTVEGNVGTGNESASTEVGDTETEVLPNPLVDDAVSTEESGVTEETVTSEESEPVQESTSAPEQQLQPESEPQPEPEQTPAPEPVAAEVSMSWSQLPIARQFFPLAQEVITTEITPATESVPNEQQPLPVEETTPEEQPGEETVPDGVVGEEVSNEENQEVSTEVEADGEDEISSPADEDVKEEDVSAPEAEVDFETEEVSSSTDEESLPSDEELVEAEEVLPNIMDDCNGDPECKLYSTTFTGFAMPEFASGHFLTAAQLRLSLGAKTKNQDFDGPQRFVVEYSYDPTEPWRTATVIDIEEEVSNSLNGGYFLVSLDKPSHQSQLSLLRVRISYQGDISYLDEAFIESIWLEVTSASFYEEADPDYFETAIGYERDLLLPKFHELNNLDLDPSLSELPSFTLSYSPQQGFLRRTFTAVFSENEYTVDAVHIIDQTGVAIKVPVDIIYHDDKTWTVQFLEKPQKLVPGKYTVELIVNENESLYVDTFEFYWGVLAVNTTKSMYFPGEDITLNLAALTEEGDTICDAHLELKVIDPDNTIFEIPVEQSGSCGKNNVTDIPDYLAYFKEADLLGTYTIQLQNINRNGEAVHKIQDHFEVREYIPYDIERTAPTRIYPLAPYDVTLKIAANRSFEGDITERVPRGFVFEAAAGAEVLSMPDYTELVWRDVKMEEGDTMTLSYRFDAPDISPYMFLLGPLNMDGFTELRQWQIASDALTAIASFSGTRTVAGTNLNQTTSAMQWSTSSVDTFYYSHSTSTDSHEVTLRQAGDYFLSVTLPQQRTDANARGTRVGVEVKVNGTSVPEGLGRSSYIANQNGHAESSAHANFLLSNITAYDVVEVYVEGLTTINAADIVNTTGQASMYLEYIGSGAGVFAATTTETTNSTNFNQTTEYAMKWVEKRQDSGFVHSDTLNPEQIVISNPGTYLVEVSVPLTTSAANTNILGRVRLDGALVPGGEFKQGWAQAPATESDPDSSIHWSGIVVATTTNQVLTLTTTREGNAGTVTVPTGFVGSVMVRELPSTELIVLRGTAVVGGTNWNPAAAAAIQWSTQVAKDATFFTHSTSTNSHQITIASDGDYFISYNDALNGAVTRANSRVSVLKNGTAISGAQTKSHYIRNQNGHAESSAALAMLLEGLVNGDVLTITTQAEGAAGTLNDSTDGILLLWKKAEIDYRPDAPIMYNAPFDNIRFASTTPYFDFSATDPDGSSNIEYEFSIATSTGFTASTTFNSVTDSEFFNTASSTDTSPFVEGNKIRLQLTSGDALTDLSTYYWRVRARDVSGSGEFGDWSTTQSLTVDMAVSAPSWYQSYSGQFEGDTLVGTVSSGADRVQVDASVSGEVLIAYGEGTVTTPRYRFWDGSNWGLEGSAVAVTNTINWVRTAAAVSRDEYAMVTLDASNDAFAQIYSASTSSWGNQVLLSPVVTSAAYRGVAVAYESLSGDAMAVSCTNGANPVYRIWNGSSWSATSSITVSSPNNCNFLDIASDPASDEIILLVRDTGVQYEALVWDGSAWVESRVIGSSALVAREGMSVAYESSGEQAVITVSDNTNSNILYTTWNGTEFSTNATQAIGNDFEFGRLTTDPDTDMIALCYIDTDNDIGVLRWDGGVWTTLPFQELDITGNIDTGRPIDCAYETLAGRSDYVMAVYSDTTNARYRYATTTVWSTEASVGTIEDSFWVQTERAGDGTILAVALDDTADDLDASYWNGSAWSAEQTLEASPSSVIVDPYEMYDMSAKRFQFSEGIVLTPPIDFTAVPSQPTWGDINFSTTEPFGTDVSVRVKYTSTTTCDSYISNAVLSGNGAGFDVLSSPIDLTSLSTSTYSQICLEATLTTLGSESASLEEWTLAWVRQPKLIQNRYRFYVNGSVLTPTDAWPAGFIDVAENAALTSDMAISTNEAIRLRLSLQGSNVELPAFSEAFKLQYAEGFTCSQSLTWHDVGAPASTTALWRGYENSIVGSDWYSASWGRRVKLTVDSAVVDATVTDFPVYVNLSDLPTSFFDSIQADGDDIRITEADGVTELPFELVTINTSTDTGELHFKADLSSTTDTEFYIYYRNPSASGYSASATYGRNNVWTNGYEAVYHLETSPSSALTDSTSNGRNITAAGGSGMGAGNSTSSVMGNGIDFDGVNDRLTNAGFAWTAVPVTVTAWNNVATAEVKVSNIFGFTLSGTERLASHAPWSDNTLYWDYGTCCSAPGRISTNYTSYRNKWTHIGLVSQGAGGSFMGIYLDGSLITSIASSDDPNVTLTGFSLGSDNPSGGNHLDGRVDEFRIASVARAGGWISTERNNQSNPTGFYAVSSEELISDGRLLPSTLLSESDFAETYEEENPTRDNQNSLPVGNDAEWDFVLQNNGATVDTNYCFRLVYEDGSLFNEYEAYPRLITNAPPLVTELYAPFDNERLASTTPWFEFAATDEYGDDVAYQIQVDTDAAFGSPDVDNNSISQFAQFTNLLQPAQKSEFTSGQRIRFEALSSLTNGNTYWWRVRAQDISGSGEYSEWSVPQSVTINTATVITTWFQTTGNQFATNNLQDVLTSTSTNDVGIDSGFTAGTTTSSAIDYDDKTTGNAWGDFTFTHNVTSGTIRYYFEYLVGGDTYALIPDIDLPGNSSGFTASPVTLTDLDTTTYNEIRIMAVLSGNATLPRLLDWTVTWAETIEIPTQVQPFDNAKVSTTTPVFIFTTTDPESDDIQYEIQLASSYSFAASSTFTSGVDAGFLNTENGGDTSPFASGDTIQYTVQSALTNGNTYWWRARAKDPAGDDVWSDYSVPQSFTVDTAITVSAWHQTTGDQFETDTLVDIETTATVAQITSTINEVLMAYGEGTGQAPRYRLWNGSSWSAAGTAASVGAQIRWTDLDASPTRPEYALGTVGTDNDMNVQIYDASNDSWGNVFELTAAIPDTLQRGFDMAYETTSGDLLAVSCSGDDALYAIWDGASWSATSSLALANANSCLYIELASDPVSNEITAVFKHTNTGTPDYEIMIWNGSSWGSALALGDMAENANAGAAVEYEESGNQAIVALTNNASTTLLYALWNGSGWSTSTHALGDHIEWASLQHDDGTDKIALCYVDNDINIGALLWSGSAWNTFTEIELIANAKAGHPIDCAYETLGARDGYLMAPYSDATNGRYQVYATSSFIGGEQTLSTIQDSWRVLTVRGGDGIIHSVFFDDTNDRYDVSNWNGTNWSALQTISAAPSITGTPFDGSLSLAARTYPDFTSGTIQSSDIDFAEGSGPRWEQLTFNDTTAGASYIEYHLYYLASTSEYLLIPESALPGNSTGFTTSPVDISDLDRTIYTVLQLNADFGCVAGDCPILNDWTVEWSEGVTVSGMAYEYNASTTLTSGTVAVAVNGVLQVGKTGTILGDGSWSINNVTAFEDDVITVFVEGAADADEAVSVTTYDGIGDVTNMQLARRHLTLGSADTPTLQNSQLGQYIFADDEDIFFTVNGSNQLTLCSEVTCGDAKLRVLSGTTYQPSANGTVNNFENYGTFVPATSTLRVAGDWVQNGTFTIGDSTIIFIATSTSQTLTTASTSLEFYNLTFGETSGTANWSVAKSLNTDGSLTVSYGTLARGTSTIAIGRNLQIGAAGYMSGVATTTFSGSGSYTWGDSKSIASSTNVGYVVVDGTAKTITLAGNVGAQSVTIGADDTLSASGSGYNINVVSGWINNNVFIPQSGTVTFVGTSTGSISRGASSFNNLTFSGVGGNWSFTTPTLALNGNLSIATGTVTMPTGTSTIAGSFSNTGGTFLHNNGEVRMTSTVAGRTITQSGTPFLNAFYDLVFTGSGAWSYTESAATTTNNFRIQSGTVTLPSTALTVGADFLVTGTGAFAHNNGEVILLVQNADDIRTNGSSLNNLRIKGDSVSSWYNNSWAKRVNVIVDNSMVPASVTDFPVYLNLANFPDAFFAGAQTDGDDIRITNSDGVTELPIELVSIDTVLKTGELHFKANLSSTTDSEFYVYYGNSLATAYASSSTYGRNNVWTNGYEAVYHLGTNPTATMVDSTSNGRDLTSQGGMGAGNSVSAVLGNGIDFDGVNDYLRNTTFAWTANPVTVTAWNNVATAELANANMFGFTASGNERNATHAPYSDSTLYWDYGTCCTAPGRLTASYASYQNKWTHVGLVSQGGSGSFMGIYLDGTLVSSAGSSDDPNVTLTGFAIGAGGSGGGAYHNGRVDEFRIASVARSGGWITTERNNQASSTTFFSVSGEELKFVRNFTDTNATLLGSFVSESGGNATFPSGILSIGGSFTNNAEFTATSGTVRFNSTAGTETIDAGESSFATLTFDSVTGDFTVAENATATVAVNLTNASQFTLASGRSLSVVGTFSNAVSGTATTWTGSTLRLANGGEVTLNTKTHGGDVYGTLEAASSTLVKMWNSSATSYTTSGATGAIYSQDHATVDGDLYIFGNYRRTTGTEYWSYATDFDGATLATTSRQVDVRVSTSSSVGLTNASLNLVGSASASTTIDAQTGAFSLNATNTTVTAEHFRVAGTDANGFVLSASSTLTTFRDGYFTVSPSRTGITLDASTIQTNPAAQYYRIGFATSSPGTATNVTLSGSPSSFVWFREGLGGLYGEAYDTGDGNPGSIRFDDSSNSIVVSGTVYGDDGITTLGGPTCDGVSQNVRIVVNGGTYASSTSCNGTTGAYSFPTVAYVGDPKVVVYLDTNGGVQGSVVTKTPTGNITNMNIYANRVITRHQDTLPLTITDMVSYDYDNDTDLRFIAATGTLTVLPNTELFVFASTTFAPGGNVTLTGNGNANGYEGTLQIGSNATFSATGTETHTLAGRFVMATTSTFTAASSTFVFNATTTGKSITSPNTVTFNQLQFNGQGGGWNITAPLSISADMYVATGTVTGTSNITLSNGSLYGNGVLSLGSGTTTINRSNTLGGTSAWTFNNLTLGNGTVVGTTTPASAATTTVLGVLTIANAHFLDANASLWDLAGTGNVFVETGTYLEDTSTLRFSGAGANIPSTNYYNLRLDAGVGSATYTAVGSGVLVLNDLVVGGTANSVFTLNTNDPVLEVRGDASVLSNGTLEASNSAVFTILGDYTNDGIFTSNVGTVRFTGTGTSNIAAGSSPFATLEINGTGTYVVNENATATVALSLIAHNNFTVASGTTVAIGGTFLNNIAGTNTTWTGSTLSLYGAGTYEINDSATSDAYETLVVANNTHARVWNSTATSYSVGATGSLYSQDHAGVNGDLYIFGQLARATGDDFWSYAIDFDGTDLSGGSERAAHVYFASGAGATYAGSATLSVIGTTAATTTIENQGSGTYGLTIGGSATTEWNYAQLRDINASGVVFTGTPVVTNFSHTDHLVEINSASAVTVGGTVINTNEAKNFTNNIFAAAGGVTGAINVTATGTSVSSWRFTNHTGNIAGEGDDSDPAGDPGYLVWDDSAALIAVAGNVYGDEGVTVSSVCDGFTSNIRLVVAGLTTYDTTCDAGTGAFSISGVAFSPLDTLTLFINGETEQAANVTVAPISSISNMHLYENRVIVRHENTDPLTIAQMAIWDSSDDADIPFTAVDAGTDTLTLPANHKLLIWTGKTFEPNGNVTVSGGGAGAAHDGTLEAAANARFRAKTTEVHSVGGSVIFGAGAEFVSASSTLTLTTTGASRTFDINTSALHNLTVSGAGSYVTSEAVTTINGSYTQSTGAFTFGTGTTTIGAAFNVSGGSFTNNGSPFIFTATGAGNTVRFNNSVVAGLTFSGTGSWNMTDTNATSTGSVRITAGGVTLPSGSLTVGGSFEKRAGTLTHNTSDLILTATSTALLTASSSDLYAVTFAGPAAFTVTDTNITFLDSFTIASGSVAMASGTTAVGGSFVATGGSFTHATGTVLMNAAAVGKTLNPGASTFHNLQIGAPSGGYTMHSATTTNNFTLASVNTFTVNSGAAIVVGGVFANTVGGAGTTWTNSVLKLAGANAYSVNNRTNAGDVYGTLDIGANSDIRMWYSSAATTSVAVSSSLYSQDNANVNGNLYIYGDLNLATTTEYWSYATDFDGTSLTGSERQVQVYLSANATTTVTSGSLNIVGTSGNETTIQNQGTGTYTFAVQGGTLNASYYELADMDINGLQLSGLATINTLSNGYFDLALDTGSLITLSSTTLNANPSKTFDNIGFDATTTISGYNINLIGDTTNAWRFTNSYGSIDGEGFDIDGIDACGSIRFDNSSCLLTEQTHARWRVNDGGEGAPDTEWFDLSWDYRTRVRVLNNDNQAYASTAVKVVIPYDSAMQSNFADLRFTEDDGQTPIPFWVEKYTASTEVQVWVQVPSLVASDYTTVFAYYGSSTAPSISNGSTTFDAFDDYEDNSISEYSGDTTLFTTVTTPVYGGTYALMPSNTSGKTTDGIFRFDDTVAQGQIIRYMQYVNTSGGSGDEPCTLFGVQSPGTTNANYAVCLEQFGTDRISLAKDVDNNDTSGTVLATTTVSYSTGWYEVEIDWQTDDSMDVSLFTSAGTLVASTSATDSSYTLGGYGYAFWFQNGAWDSFTSRARVATEPTVYLGTKQTSGGATWLSTLDGAGTAVPGDTVRLRLSVENSGLDVTAQQYRLEYAPKDTAPTCESVDAGDYVIVPNQASCGSSAVCMQTSAFVADSDSTTDLLFGTEGTFSAGKVVESPSNETSALDVDQSYYTELEYVLTPTSNATDSYCFRVSNAGTVLDFYAKVAELSMQFDPSFGSVSLNAGLPISLTPGTTTPVTVLGTVTDFNGPGDLEHATATVYRSGAGASCTPDNNSCYIATTENGLCSFTGCVGNSCDLSCTIDAYFHADPTDAAPYEGQEWLAYAEVEDFNAGYDFASAPGVELNTLRAIEVDSLINYGSLAADSDTGSFNPTTTVTNLGNTPVNIDVEGTSLSDGLSSSIPANLQKVATSTFTYSACVSCQQLSTTSAVTLGLNLTKPSAPTPPVVSDVYWGIAVPFTASNAAHTGTNIFTAIGL